MDHNWRIKSNGKFLFINFSTTSTKYMVLGYSVKKTLHERLMCVSVLKFLLSIKFPAASGF